MGDGTDQGAPVPLGLQPFSGLRFGGDAATVAARTMTPPDAWGDADDLGAGEPHHVARLLEPAFTPGDGGPRLDAWEGEGIVLRDPPAVYVYRRSGPDGATRGLLGAMDLSGRTSAPLIPHEDVRPELVEVQQDFAAQTHAQVDPVVAIAGAPAPTAPSPLSTVLDQVTAGAPDLTLVDGVETHELWVHTSPEVHRAVARTPVGRVLVADGHHRRRAWTGDGGSTAWGLTWVVDDTVEPLRLRAVHRVCPGLDLGTIEGSPLVVTEEVDADAALGLLADAGVPRCVAYAGGRWLDVRPAPGAVAPSCALPDHAICWLHQVWLPGWGADVDELEYVHDARAAVRRADGADAVALLLPPTRLSAVRAAAYGGTTLPAKATSFVPKPRMGLVMRHWGSDGDDVSPVPATPADTD
ncbi:DUF1015 family protein [Solicola sp. PLA-1-18]|uniref:DUF1015 family protein n=1 Tax=Solicola sp. PLA-1-18 TaxID=3380532 RepID=UPI003B793685